VILVCADGAYNNRTGWDRRLLVYHKVDPV
jgi:hypothetical protein